jgi:D-alanine-D-alanine ligase
LSAALGAGSGPRPDLARARVAVLSGGISDERSVALESARGILAALRDGGADGRGPARVEEVRWLADGRLEWAGEPVSWSRALAHLAEFDVVFLGVHGGPGEDGTLQGALALAGVRCTGSGVAASALAMDKVLAKHVAQGLGLAVAPGRAVERQEWAADPAGVIESLLPLARRGAMVKPRCGGSSVGAVRTAPGEDLTSALDQGLGHAEQVLVEGLVEGVEATCAVLGSGARARALPPVEIRPAAGRYFDFQQKYAADGARELCPPQGLSAEAVARIERDALAMHRTLGCAGLTRVDFLVEDEGAGRPVFLELNTLPGFTERSLAPLAARVVGLSYRDLCLALVEDALARPPGGPHGPG